MFPPDTRERRDIPKYELEMNRLNHSGFSTFHILVLQNEIEKIKTYIEFGVDINLQSYNKITPLEIALTNNFEEIAWLLLENGAKIPPKLKSQPLPDRTRYITKNYEFLEKKVAEAINQNNNNHNNNNTSEFELKFKYFPKLPDEFGRLQHLTSLFLSYNNLLTIDENIVKLTRLEKLDLSHNLIQSIPSSFKALTNLRFINLSNNYIEKCDELFEIDLINEVLLSNNKLTLIPRSISNLKKLTKLDLSNNALKSLPETFIELSTLNYLDLSNNFYSSFDLQVKLMTSLAYLDISHNQITSCYFQDILLNIKTFRFAGNKFPIDMYRIFQTHYDQSPTLNLSCLSLQTLPREITLLTSLKELNLSNNALTQVPEEIGQIPSLTILDLSYNRITHLPLFLHRLNNLVELKLEGTKTFITSPPRSIVDKGIKSIRGYYSDLLKEGDPCYRMKLMFVGQENVGKSSLLYSLINFKNKKAKKKVNISTDGIEIERWSFKTNKQTITFSTWDFAGQEIYYTTHSFFLSTKAIYILVWDLRYSDDQSRMEFWLNSISSKASNAPVILCATHYDDPMFNGYEEKIKSILVGISDKYGSRFPNIVGISAVSTVTNENVPGVLNLIKTLAIERVETLGTRLPKIYLNLEEEIFIQKEKENPPALYWSNFVKFASSINFKDEEQLLRATHFLHDLGTIVLFEDDRLSNRLIILDPQWLTNTFASVITTSHSYIKNGILRHCDLDQIWRAPTYPPALHPTLISLLEQFEILYHLPNDVELQNENEGIQYLVPSLLQEEKPPLALLWPLYDTCDLEFTRIYNLEYIPNGLFSRVIVRFLHFSDLPLKYWRNGVVARKNNCKALVELKDKIIEITVRGSQFASEYLRVIIEIIDTLTHSWFKVKVLTIKIICPHCLLLRKPKEDAYQFEFKRCEEAATCDQKRMLNCPTDGSIVRLDSMVPDICMTDFQGAVISFSEVELEKKIGTGSYGVIYRGRWNGGVVAVKKLKVEAEDVDANMAAFAEFRREVWLMSGLQHPCIVNLLGYSISPLAMIMECVTGGDLYGLIHNLEVEFDWQIRLKIALDMAMGMNFLHTITPPLLHRDLKSPNVLVMNHRDGSPVIAKIADFGLSSRMFVEKYKDRAVENPTWCAPEVMMKKPYTEKADVYSYGIILWELLTRELPFSEYTFQYKVEDDVIHGIRPLIPNYCWPAFADLIKRCWHADPNTRPRFDEIIQHLIEMIDNEIGRNNFRYPLIPINDSSGSALHSHRSQTILSLEVAGNLLKKTSFNSTQITSLLWVKSQVWAATSQGKIIIFGADSAQLITSYDVSSASLNCLTCVKNKVWCGGDDSEITVWRVDEHLSTTDLFKGKAGYLSKRGGTEKRRFRKWQLRWCQIDDKSILRYFKQQSNSAAAGEINLKEAKLEKLTENKFNIITQSRVYLFQAKNEDEFQSWTFEIAKAISSSPTLNNEASKKLNNGKICEILGVGENVFVCHSSTVVILDAILRAKGKIALTAQPASNFKIVINNLWVTSNNTIRRYSLNDYKEVDELSVVHKSQITSIVSFDKYVWTASQDGIISQWNSLTGENLGIIHQDPDLRWTNLYFVGTSVLASAGKSIYIFDSKSNEFKKVLTKHIADILRIEIVLDNLIWSCSATELFIWN